MAKRRTMSLRSAVSRLVAVTSLTFSFYNPSGLHAVALLRADVIGTWPKLLVAAGYLTAFAILFRLAWCGLDPFGRWVPLVLSLGVGVLLWDHRAFAWASPGAATVVVVLLLCLGLTVGQVAAYYIRQVSGQQPVLKTPP